MTGESPIPMERSSISRCWQARRKLASIRISLPIPGYLGGPSPNSSVYTTFTSADGVDLYVASCAAPCNLPALPSGAPPSKLNFTSTLAFTAPPGAAVGNVFTPIAVDNDGNLYVAFSMQQLDTNGNQTGQNVYVIWSTNGGKTWSKALQVNNPADAATATAMLPWLTAGDQGNVGVFWYGTNVVGNPNSQSIFANAKWKMFYAYVNITTTKPSVQYVVASGTTTGTADQMAGVVHYGSICTQGLNCNTSVPAGNRELAEYSELTHDPLGMIHMAFSEDNVTAGTAFTWYNKQVAGPGLIPNVGTGARLLQPWKRYWQSRLPGRNEDYIRHPRGDAKLSRHFRAHPAH